MTRILVAASQALPGAAAVKTLSLAYDVCEIALKRRPLTAANVKAIKAMDADVLLYIGDLARSSWDTHASSAVEAKTLAQATELSEELQMRMIFVSTDCVYGGPTVFHDEESRCLSRSPYAQTALKYEQLVAGLNGGLIIRTNIVDGGCDPDSFCNQTLSALERCQPVSINASIHSTPIALETFCRSLLRVVQHNLTGVVNIGGAERTTPFCFAAQLAPQLGFDPRLVEPNPGKPSERSLRCGKLREIGVTAPLLRETIEMLSVGEYAPELMAA